MKIKRKRKPVEKRSYSHNYAIRHQEQGLCLLCPNRTEFNPHTGKPHLRCPRCLKKIAAKQKILMRKRRRKQTLNAKG